MQKASSLPGRRLAVSFLTAALVVAADQLSKACIRSHIALWDSLPVTGWFQFSHVRNTGAVFGMFQGEKVPLIIGACIGVALLLALTLVVHRWFPPLDNILGRVALGLVLGGTIGNLIDRVRLGYVTDFIDFGFWPAFNIADSSTVVGFILLAALIILPSRADKRPA